MVVFPIFLSVFLIYMSAVRDSVYSPSACLLVRLSAYSLRVPSWLVGDSVSAPGGFHIWISSLDTILARISCIFAC